ncbi:histone-lysine N-methyltransferase SETMAR [Trichonephila clavipes]|nr:histone-lysine N-methyltransferase SETMAR [Trichonephila clavipes]
MRVENHSHIRHIMLYHFEKGGVAAVAEWYRYRIVACHVTSSSPVPLKAHRVGQRCTLNLSRAETSSRCKGTISESQCREWFARFILADTSFEDKPGIGRSSDFDDQALLAAVEEDESLKTRMMAEDLNVNQSFVVRRLKKLGKVWKIAGWVSHELRPQQIRLRSNFHRVTAAKRANTTFEESCHWG